DAIGALGPACLPVGSAGLAAHLPIAWGLTLASPLPLGEGQGQGVSTSPLFVCGSLNPRTREQVERLEAAPIDAAAPSALDQAVAFLRQGEPAVLSSASWPASATAEQIASALGRLVAG